MAKKTVQQQFEADGFPEKPPKSVTEACGEFLTAKRAHARTGEKLATKHEALIEEMHKHGITKIQLDDENKFIEIEPTEKAKVKTVPKEKRDKRTQAEALA